MLSEAMSTASTGLVRLFSYGSNNVRQLQGRLQTARDIVAFPAILPGYMRVFAEYSTGWEGGCASVVPAPDQQVQGLVALLTHDEIAIIDKFERVAEGMYEHVHTTATVHYSGDHVEEAPVLLYSKVNVQEFAHPSNAYCSAIFAMITFGFPEVELLPICKHDGSLVGHWSPKPFRQMCLPSFLTEVGMRLPQPWTLPVEMNRKLELCDTNGVRDVVQLASVSSEGHDWFYAHFREAEREIIARLLNSEEYHPVWKQSLGISS